MLTETTDNEDFTKTKKSWKVRRAEAKKVELMTE